MELEGDLCGFCGLHFFVLDWLPIRLCGFCAKDCEKKHQQMLIDRQTKNNDRGKNHDHH